VTGRLVVVWLLSSILLTLSTSAQDGEPSFDVLVRIDDPRDRLLLDRVRGQTSDLNILLFTDSTSPLEPTLPEQLETARRLSQTQHTRVVVWFRHTGDTLSVFVAEPAAGRVLVRDVEPSEGRLASSAQQEAAALVVRSAMRALAAGGEIGVTEQAAAPAPTPAPAIVKQVPRPVPREPLPVGWELAQFLGGRSAWDGAGKLGQHGLFGRLTLRRGRYQGELRAALGISSHLDDDIARVSLLRHGVSLHAAYVAWENERFIVSTALGGGINLFLTRVDARGMGFRADDSSALLPVVSADATLRFMPGWTHGRVGIACLLGADVLPAALTVGYQGPDGSFVARDRISHVLPSVSLELVVRLK